MKTLVCIVALVCAAVAMPQAPPAQGQTQGGQTQGQTQGQAAPSQTGATAPQNRGPQYGPNFYGQGLNNPRAFAPSPAAIAIAQRVVASNANVRVRVNVDGTVEYTDQFGREVEIHARDALGRLIEIPDPEEAAEMEFERMQQQRQIQRELHQRRLDIERQQAVLAQLTRQLGGGAGLGGANAGVNGGTPGGNAASALHQFNFLE